MKAIDIAFRWCTPETRDRLMFQNTLEVRAGKRVGKIELTHSHSSPDLKIAASHLHHQWLLLFHL
jgi:hypothetical protein